MKLSRRPQGEAKDQEDPPRAGLMQRLRTKKDAAEDSGDLDITHLAGQRLATKFANIGLAAIVMCGPVSLYVASSMGSRPVQTTRSSKPEGVMAQDAARAGEFAQRVVRAWLSATRDKVGDFGDLYEGASGFTLPDKPIRVDSTETANVTPTSVAGIFQVTVAAAAEGTQRYYTVPVQVTAGSLSALALPAPMPAPVTTPDRDPAYRTTLPSTGPTATAVLAFLRALLTGQGDVTRYISPGAPIVAVAPAPYQRVDLRTVTGLSDEAEPAEGELAHVLATAIGTDAAKRPATTQYALTLKARGGRWEVSGIDLAPAITKPRTAPPTSPQTSPSSPR
jgi:hypothetical protein